MKIIAILLYVYLVSSNSCPNACSGHGICTTSGVCVCNRQTGLALNNGDSNSFTYTGADCSQRTCPNGYSFATPWDLATPIYPPTVSDYRTRTLENIETDITIEESQIEDVYKVTGANYSINAEGGTLQCSSRKTKKALGIATVLTMEKNVINQTEVKSYYVRYDFSSDPDPDNYTCTVASQRNDLSLFKPTKITIENKDYSIIYRNTKDIFNIMKWKLLSKESSDAGVEIEENGNNESNLKQQQFACYGKDLLIQYYPINSMEFKNDDVIFDIGNDLEEIQSNTTCYLLTKADGTPVKMEDSDLSKLCRKNSENGDWYYGIIDLSPFNDNTDDNVITGITEEGNYVLATDENVSKEINNIIKSDNSQLFIPIPTKDVNSASISNTIVEGMLVTVTIMYVDNDISIQQVKIMGVKSNYNINIENNNNNNNRILLEEVDDEEITTTTTTKSMKKQTVKRKLQNKDNNNKIPGILTNTLPEISIKENGEVKLFLIEITGESDTHVLMECSGAGVCNRATGECECYSSYDGDACQRLSCPNNCNGNGRCVKMTEGLLNNEDSINYYGFGSADVNGDKVYVCLCDPGKRGPDCSMIECPSSQDPQSATNINGESEYRDCSGRGICDYDNGICSCFKGYYGEACQKMIEVQ